MLCVRVCTLTPNLMLCTLQGEHLDSVEASEIKVTVGGEECTKTTTSNSRGSDIFCTVPLVPPGGVNPAIIIVSQCLACTVCVCHALSSLR